MTTVGILGGGQLARMLALAGAPLGLRFLVMDSAAEACAAQFAPMVVGDYRDDAALAEFASRIDVATFDFENVPAESARWLSGRVPVFPSPRALATAQDRLAEKTLFRELGIPVPDFAPVATRDELDAAVARIGTPCILKTRRLGYDGKGQFRLRGDGDVAAAWDALGAQAAQLGHRCLFGKEGLRAVADHLLLFGEDQRHRQASGRPSTRLAMMLSCTSVVPPSMELALERSHSRVQRSSSASKASPSQPSPWTPSAARIIS